MRKVVLLASLVLLALPATGFAQSRLDAPVSTKPTVKSEIKRGGAAAFDCGLKGNITDYSAFTACINAVQDSNQQKNTNSEPFLLGLSVTALAHTEAIRPDLGTGWVSIWRKNVVRIIKVYKLTDADLCSAFDLKCEVVKRVVSQAK